MRTKTSDEKRDRTSARQRQRWREESLKYLRGDWRCEAKVRTFWRVKLWRYLVRVKFEDREREIAMAQTQKRERVRYLILGSGTDRIRGKLGHGGRGGSDLINFRAGALTTWRPAAGHHLDGSVIYIY